MPFLHRFLTRIDRPDPGTRLVGVVGKPKTVIFNIGTAGNLEIWQHAGSMKATNMASWVDITPAGVSCDYASNNPADVIPSLPYVKNQEVMSLHTVAAGTILETSTCDVDFLVWIENPNTVPAKLSEFTLE